MNKNMLEKSEKPYPYAKKVLSLIETHRSTLYSEKEVIEKLCNIQKMEVIAEMTPGIVHDFNNILMGIQGNISLLLLGNNLDPSITSQLDKVNDLLDNGKQLTGQILSYASRGTPDTVPVNLDDAFKVTLDMYGNIHKGIKFHKYIENGPLRVKAVPGQIKQIFFNILINAGHAMSDNGHLYVDMCKTMLTENEATPFGLMPGKYIRTSITDTGTGMDTVTKQKLFDPYFTTKEEGTGLGLSIVRNIIKDHKGIITVDSEEGKGATFNIYLPEYEEIKIADNTKPKRGIIKGQGTVLVIDDDPVSLNVISEYLPILGYKALKAGGGRNAINMYDKFQNDINLVLLDMTMPGVSEDEMFNKIKGINANSKVMMMSGQYNTDRIEGLLKQGSCGFIQKPFSIESLSEKVHEALT